ncbi:MAG TPA: phosphatase PAP2 family protein [Chitinophagaceae bacterium]|jgi:undecaprenyl-diphosphatase|nr:phosphatase PAP2 family protein [Chitinophagaceae bacterium]
MSDRKNYSLYIGLFILFFTALAIFCYIATITIHAKEGGFDLNIIAYQAAHANPDLVKIMKRITLFGDTWFLFTAYTILIAYFIVKKKYRYSIAIFIVSFGAWNLSKLFKLLFQRSRPELSFIKMPTDYSFPSGHALTSFVFCSILAWLVWQTHFRRKWKWLITVFLLLFTLSIGASRIVLTVHYASDVIGGFTLGIMWVILAIIVWLRVKPVSPVLHGVSNK